MTQSAKDLITSVAFMLNVDGKPHFMLLVTAAGAVKRRGYSDPYRDEPTIAGGHEEGFFAQIMDAVPEALLEKGGDYEDPGADGPRCHWRVELGGGQWPVQFDVKYCAESAALPPALASIVVKAEDVTEAWYLEQLPETDGEETDIDDGRSMAPVTPSPAPSSAPPPAPAAAATNGPDSHASEKEPEGETARAGGPPAHAKASRLRLVFAVLLDLFVLSAAWSGLAAATGMAPPPGLLLFFFVLLEFVLLQFVRRSPGYWLLGIRAPLGAKPQVEPGLAARESLLTHITGALFLRSGLSGIVSFAEHMRPFPHFGITMGPVMSGIVNALIGAASVAAAVLIFRTDERGVRIGAGATVVGFLATFLARGEPMALWLSAEMLRRSELRGQPIDLEELQFVGDVVAVLVFAIPAAAGLLLYFTWKRLAGRNGGA